MSKEPEKRIMSVDVWPQIRDLLGIDESLEVRKATIELDTGYPVIVTLEMLMKDNGADSDNDHRN